VSHDDFFAELGIQRDEDAGSATEKPKSRKQRRMEKVERRQRKRRRHWLTSLAIVITLVAVGVLSYKAIVIMRDASAQATHAEDYHGNGEGEVTVTIPEGASGVDIGDILQQKGVVASGKAFTNAAKNNPKGSTIQPGTYKLKKKMSANAALQALLPPESTRDHTLPPLAAYPNHTFMFEITDPSDVHIIQETFGETLIGIRNVATGEQFTEAQLDQIAQQHGIARPQTISNITFGELKALLKTVEHEGFMRPLQKSPSFDSQNQNTGFLLFLPPIPPDFTQIPP